MAVSIRSKWKAWLAVAGFLMFVGLLIYGPLAIVVGTTQAKWRRENPPPSCSERAGTLASLELGIEAEREGVIACLRDESYCTGVYTPESLRQAQDRERRPRRIYHAKCTSDVKQY